MLEILEKINHIIEKSIHPKFFEEYADCMCGMGERSVDYSLYCIEINEDNFLIIDFVDFSMNSFSLINKLHKELIIDKLNTK